MTYGNCAPDGEGGVVAVWEEIAWGFVYDIYAKHLNADGTLGGPVYTPTSPRSAMPTSEAPQIQGSYANQINYILPAGQEVKIELFDLLGRKISTLAEGYEQAGAHTLNFTEIALYIAPL